MKISVKDVEQVAKLSLLSFEKEEDKEKYSRELSSIINYVEKLAELNTEEVKPTAQVLPLKNVVRKDIVNRQKIHEEILKLAPEREGDYYKVLSIMGNE